MEVMGKIEEGSKHAELVACLRFLEEDRLLANMLEQAKSKGTLALVEKNIYIIDTFVSNN